MTREEKREMWRERIEQYRSSGLTAAEWCEKNEVNVHTLKTMISRLGMAQRKYKSSRDNKQNIQWVEMEPGNSTEEVSSKTIIEVIVGSAKVNVAPGFDQKTFREVVKILKEQC